jgi:PAS domain S-box-containing protein
LADIEAGIWTAFEHTGVATVLTDIANRFLRMNSAFVGLFGHSRADLLRMSMADVTHPDDLAESYARREALLAGKEPFFQIESATFTRTGASCGA